MVAVDHEIEQLSGDRYTDCLSVFKQKLKQSSGLWRMRSTVHALLCSDCVRRIHVLSEKMKRITLCSKIIDQMRCTTSKYCKTMGDDDCMIITEVPFGALAVSYDPKRNCITIPTPIHV